MNKTHTHTYTTRTHSDVNIIHSLLIQPVSPHVVWE